MCVSYPHALMRMECNSGDFAGGWCFLINAKFAITGPQTSVDHITMLVRERQRATIDGLELGEMLGRGSFGRVYKGALCCMYFALSPGWRGAV